MARAVTIGNGNLLVGLDGRGQVRDLYYPFVGEANHVSGASGNYVHRIGVFVDGHISWLDDPGWKVSVGSEEGTCIGSLFAENLELGISISSRDAVHNEQNIFLRHFTVHNHRSETRMVKLFLSQQFRIFESQRGDTGFYDPRVNAIIHYKGDTTILVNAMSGKQQFQEYNIGLFGIEGREGTYLDAVDGVLECNPIEHGSVDSVLGLSFQIAGQSSNDAYYWVVFGKSIAEVHMLDEHVLTEEPERLIASTEAYWHAWLEKEQTDLSLLSAELQTLYRRSLLVMRVHTDNRGGIIASSDTDMLHHGRDTYSYVWPRDAAVIAHAFDVAGYRDVSRRFFEFIAERLDPSGYLMHKYRSDGALGSSWHPWIINGEPRLPIQEDETATVVFMLWEHYERYHDVEFIESMYNKFIEPAAEFMCEYIESLTGLPQASFDLWEEKYGTSTYTAASVYGGLMAAAKFANTLGKDEASRTYQAVAQRMQRAIGDVLFDEQKGVFMKHVLHTSDGDLEFDRTLDTSSLYGLQLFRVFDSEDEKMERMCKAVLANLQVKGNSEGFVRYEGDAYYQQQDAGSPNPWVITTLWVARYYIEKAEKLKDLKYPLELLQWTASHANHGGLLAEQMHPDTRQQLSTSPLVWSHAEFVLAVRAYLDRVEAINEQK
ncbi:MAG: glycoside hydrolase family 15 protein [Candidatus Kaiserbacteria bacterium]|nr:glycoside hydrolase family 15 protein [Candidatus Kaiserbacteria bacterium]MCB9816194.1 glycoside hydrolase family 15 protein [Candidatus Nomurabacteria bacterium]